MHVASTHTYDQTYDAPSSAVINLVLMIDDSGGKGGEKDCTAQLGADRGREKCRDQTMGDHQVLNCT